MNEEIYMIWNQTGGIPRVRHGSLRDARQEAERLAEKEAGDTFYIVRVVESVRLKEKFDVRTY